MSKRIKFSPLEKVVVAAVGTATFIAAREPITKWYTDFFAERAEIKDYLDAFLAAGHVTSVGLLTATAIGFGVAYATKKGIEYAHKSATPTNCFYR